MKVVAYRRARRERSARRRREPGCAGSEPSARSQPSPFLASAGGLSGTASAQVEEPLDRQALLELFSATEGHSWNRSDNWGTDLPLGQWHGVTTERTGRVIRLDLAYNGLAGELPSSLFRPDRS